MIRLPAAFTGRRFSSIISNPAYRCLRPQQLHCSTTTTATTIATMNGQLDESLLEEGGLSVTQEKRASGLLVTVELCRERALNALIPKTFESLHSIIAAMPKTSDSQILILGRGRAFSAGGDVRTLRQSVISQEQGISNVAKRRAAAASILSTEYQLMARMARLRGNPLLDTIAVSDGFTFGAGLGLFQVCKRRMVTPNALFAMPECMIGLIPDCGATHWLVRTPGCVGMYIAMTGARISAGDALAVGLADGAVRAGWKGGSLQGSNGIPDDEVSERIEELETDLANADSDLRGGIDDAFSKESVEEVVKRLGELEEKKGMEWSKVAKKAILAASPRAMFETFRTMKEGYRETNGLDAAFERELEVDSDLASRWDFEEGVRAALIDKDLKPKWEAFDPTKYNLY